MALQVGGGLFPAYIASDRLHEICTQDTPPIMSLWERIKDFFLGNKQREALDCLYKLCHPSIHFTSEEAEDIFFRLKELASKGHKEKFCHNHIYSSCTSKLHIKDNQDNDLLCIEQYGMLCNYTILGKRFVFYDESIPFSPPRYRPGELPISVTFHKETPPIKEDEQWMRNGVLCLSSKKNILSLDFNELSNEIINAVKLSCENIHFNEWKYQEKTTYWSAIVNKSIDDNVVRMGMALSNTERKEIFDIVQKNLDIKDLTLDIVCAQSSIKHIVLTMLNKRKELIDFVGTVSSCRDEGSKIMSKVVNAIAHRIYENLFNEDGDLAFLEQQVNKIHTAVDTWLREKETAN